MIETAIITFLSGLSGFVVSTVVQSSKYEKLVSERAALIEAHHQQVADLLVFHEENKYKLKLECQERNESHLLANQELRILNSKAEQTITDLTNELYDVKTKLNRCEWSYTEMSTEHNKLTSDYAIINEALSEAQQQVDSYSEGIRELQSNLEQVQQELETSRQECEQVKANYVAMATQANEEIAKLQEMLKNYHKALDQTAKKNQELLALAQPGTVLQ